MNYENVVDDGVYFFVFIINVFFDCIVIIF